jgi:hypothetical protein
MKRKKITLTSARTAFSRFSSTFGRRAIILAIIIVSSKLASAEGVSAGFLFDHLNLTLESGFRTEAAGPFYYSQHADGEDVLAFPPFFSHQSNPAIQSDEYDFLYPIFTQVKYGQERKWQFFQVINMSSGVANDETIEKQITLFPIYFQQRSADTNLDYTAIFPFYGRLENRLFRNEIYFIMFPAYVQTRKRDVVTDNYFYPFVDVERGDGLKG